MRDAVTAVAAVHTAGIAYENRLLLYCMATLSVSSAWVNRVLVVETSTHRVALDDLVAHSGRSYWCLELPDSTESQDGGCGGMRSERLERGGKVLQE